MKSKPKESTRPGSIAPTSLADVKWKRNFRIYALNAWPLVQWGCHWNTNSQALIAPCQLEQITSVIAHSAKSQLEGDRDNSLNIMEHIRLLRLQWLIPIGLHNRLYTAVRGRWNVRLVASSGAGLSDFFIWDSLPPLDFAISIVASAWRRCQGKKWNVMYAGQYYCHGNIFLSSRYVLWL